MFRRLFLIAVLFFPIDLAAHIHKASQHFHETTKGVKLRAIHMQAALTPPQTVIVFFPGRASFFEKIEDFLGVLAGHQAHLDKDQRIDNPFQKLQSDVWCLEYRAHGKSGGRLEGKDHQKNHIDSFDTYLQDAHHVIENVIRQAYPRNTRFIFIGISMGGKLALSYVQTYQPQISNLILLAPMLEFNTGIWPQWTAKLISQVMVGLGFEKDYAIGFGDYVPDKNRFGKTKSHHCKEAYEADCQFLSDHPECCTGGPTYGWVKAAFEGTQKALDPKRLKSITIPVTFILAEEDVMVENKASLDASKSIPNAQVITIQGAWHNLVRESDTYRTPVFQAIWNAL